LNRFYYSVTGDFRRQNRYVVRRTKLLRLRDFLPATRASLVACRTCRVKDGDGFAFHRDLNLPGINIRPVLSLGSWYIAKEASQ